MPVYDDVPDLELAVAGELALVAGFLRIRDSQLSVIPKDAAARGRAFPTPRTWDYAARLSAFARAVGAPKAVRRLLVTGCLGEAVAHEYLAWTAAQDLPDPEALLADVDGLRPRGAAAGPRLRAAAVRAGRGRPATHRRALDRRRAALRQGRDAPSASTPRCRSSGRCCAARCVPTGAAVPQRDHGLRARARAGRAAPGAVVTARGAARPRQARGGQALADQRVDEPDQQRRPARPALPGARPLRAGPGAAPEVPRLTCDERWRVYVNPDWLTADRRAGRRRRARPRHLAPAARPRRPGPRPARRRDDQQGLDGGRPTRPSRTRSPPTGSARRTCPRPTTWSCPRAGPPRSTSRSSPGCRRASTRTVLRTRRRSRPMPAAAAAPTAYAASTSCPRTPTPGRSLPEDARDIRRRVAIEYRRAPAAARRATSPATPSAGRSRSSSRRSRWEPLLAGAVRRAAGWANGRTDYTYARPSRRQSSSPRILLPGMRRPRAPDRGGRGHLGRASTTCCSAARSARWTAHSGRWGCPTPHVSGLQLRRRGPPGPAGPPRPGRPARGRRRHRHAGRHQGRARAAAPARRHRGVHRRRHTLAGDPTARQRGDRRAAGPRPVAPAADAGLGDPGGVPGLAARAVSTPARPPGPSPRPGSPRGPRPRTRCRSCSRCARRRRG